ncbi:YidB family protein [Robbsia sp. Bb-Pol-6]|uniref:YidB family protein n=1 Tax=Robbsia betulipollinis TaxID=2981849 RepID=A0ABT3ZSC7_9BURK|nr:YidB family protein [Robbsia betulipollinis]MCY0389458.1 YidB family protein [Robbsia betulipollinis]
MSIFDSLASSFGQTPSGNGTGTDAGAASGGMIGEAMNFINNQPGGVSGLIDRFHQHGAGDIVESWIGNGENKSIEPELLTKVLGSETVTNFAQKFGMSSEQLSGMLAMVLPNMVDRATPDGQVPADGKLDTNSVLGSLGGLAGLFGKSENKDDQNG